mmetsp:Transcript_14059/g.49506  ORF Transcript_14059/g.49506 Transcript_14059/m.49506 type:complete len:226 (+) Transcript_14059:146-823(+)
MCCGCHYDGHCLLDAAQPRTQGRDCVPERVLHITDRTQAGQHIARHSTSGSVEFCKALPPRLPSFRPSGVAPEGAARAADGRCGKLFQLGIGKIQASLQAPLQRRRGRLACDKAAVEVRAEPAIHVRGAAGDASQRPKTPFQRLYASLTGCHSPLKVHADTSCIARAGRRLHTLLQCSDVNLVGHEPVRKISACPCLQTVLEGSNTNLALLQAAFQVGGRLACIW